MRTEGARRIGWSLLLVVLCAFAADRLRAILNARIYRVAEESTVYALPPPGYVKAASIGYYDAVASILWASTLYQYGERLARSKRFEYATQYTDTILELDPKFTPAYRFISTLATMQVVAPERRELDGVRRILEQGTRELPENADVWGAYVSFMMFEGAQFLDDNEKMKWRVIGAPAAQRAVELGYFMDTIALTGALFLERAGERGLAITQLERAYALAPNDATRERIAAKLRQLQGAATVERIQRVQQFFFTTWRDQFPWLEESAVVLLGPQRATAKCAGLVGESAQCAPGWSGAAAAPSGP